MCEVRGLGKIPRENTKRGNAHVLPKRCWYRYQLHSPRSWMHSSSCMRSPFAARRRRSSRSPSAAPSSSAMAGARAAARAPSSPPASPPSASPPRSPTCSPSSPPSLPSRAASPRDRRFFPLSFLLSVPLFVPLSVPSSFPLFLPSSFPSAFPLSLPFSFFAEGSPARVSHGRLPSTAPSPATISSGSCSGCAHGPRRRSSATVAPARVSAAAAAAWCACEAARLPVAEAGAAVAAASKAAAASRFASACNVTRFLEGIDRGATTAAEDAVDAAGGYGSRSLPPLSSWASTSAASKAARAAVGAPLHSSASDSNSKKDTWSPVPSSLRPPPPPSPPPLRFLLPRAAGDALPLAPIDPFERDHGPRARRALARVAREALYRPTRRSSDATSKSPCASACASGG